MNRKQRWLVMSVLCLSGGIIYMLPFLREVYYIPMQLAFGYDNTQMGVLMSSFGIASLATYFPGGWIADRYSPRKLIAFSLFSVGMAGFYFATYPSYHISLAIHFFWGMCTSLIFWSAMIKATRNCAPPEEQGRIFGVLESGRGITEVVCSSIFLAVFAWLGSEAKALSQVINLFALCNVLLAIVAWFVLDDHQGTEREASARITLGDVIAVLKMPAVWLISIVVLTSYSAYWGSYYFAPYATDIFSLSVIIGASIAVGKMWTKPIAAVAAGFIADKFGIAKTVFAFTLLMTACFMVFGILPGGEAYVWIMLINVVVVSLAIFALRGIYFALLDETGIAPAVTGTAVGVISAIGFTPDIFMPILGGVLLDAYPGAEGYRYYYAVIAAMCACGAFAAFKLMQMSARELARCAKEKIEQVNNTGAAHV